MTHKRAALWMFASVGLVATAGVGVTTRLTGQSAQPRVSTVAVARGDVVELVSATGTLEAVTTVNVGSQVSGTVQTLYADFNDLVRKGHVLARLDPSLFQTQVEQARASVTKAEADVQRQQVALDSSRLALERTKKLAAKRLVADADLEAADVDVRTAEAQLRSSAAAVAQARASLNQAEVNLANTVIVSPIDGIVMARSVDAGQTVAASMQAPTLFTLAADLSRMRVNANLDESDIGRVEAGQPVTFRVDAYPNDSFDGTVAQVRLQPTVSQNVVTYVTVINVANPGLRLKPGMTATVSIEIARRNNVLHVASPALRVRPTADAIAALGGTSAPLGAGRTPQPAGSGSSAGATLWLFEGGVLKAVPVRTGVSNGTVTEIVSGDVKEGDVVAASIALATTSAKTTTGAATTVRSPLMGGMPGPPPGGPR